MGEGGESLLHTTSWGRVRWFCSTWTNIHQGRLFAWSSLETLKMLGGGSRMVCPVYHAYCQNENGRRFGIYVCDANGIFPALMDAHKQIARKIETKTEASLKGAVVMSLIINSYFHMGS
uniref:Uncharacterized protein n=1 Tax=Triticum urartu TaxID=4572 RepID=A0A8R7PCF5_TRIUA